MVTAHLLDGGHVRMRKWTQSRKLMNGCSHLSSCLHLADLFSPRQGRASARLGNEAEENDAPVPMLIRQRLALL
jgi:hypothetical protein